MPTIDPSVGADYARIDAEREAAAEAARVSEAYTPDHRKVWKGVQHVRLPAAAPLKAKAPAQTALNQQMQAEEIESHPLGLLPELWNDGRSNN